MKYLLNFINKEKIVNLLLFGFLIKILVLIFYGVPDFGDVLAYKRAGEEIFSLKLVSTTIHMPGYGVWMYFWNYFLQNSYGVIFADIIISTITIYIVYCISKIIFQDEVTSRITLIICCFYPFFIFYSISSLSETLYVFLLFLSILLFYKNLFFLGSLSIIFSIYVKSISLFIAPILIIVFYIFVHKHSLINTLKKLLLYFALFCTFLAPWWLHNFKKYDTFVITDLSYGYHLFSGNNPENTTGGGIGGRDITHTNYVPNYDYYNADLAIKADRIFKEKAYEYISNNPKTFIYMTFNKFKRLWSLYPKFDNEEFNIIDNVYNISKKNFTTFEFKLISFISYGPILFLFLFFIFFHYKKFFIKTTPLISIILLFTFAHCVTIASIRYRFPIEPILIIFASYSFKNFLFKKNS